MALIKCPECGKEISEYAIQCGYCFYPLKEKAAAVSATAAKASRIRNGKPSRNGNGAGSITHVKANLRKPYRVRVTTGWKYDAEKGRVKQVRRNIGYYETREAAENALANYRQNPYDLDAAKITFAEIYDRWSAEHFPTISQSNILF